VALDLNSATAAVALSVVSPCYNEQECLPEFHRRVSEACGAAVGGDYEIVLVNDGSTDATRRIVEGLSQADPRVVGVHLMRNHGHQLAAPPHFADWRLRYDYVLLLNADAGRIAGLSELPELVLERDEGFARLYRVVGRTPPQALHALP
jgi:polyisoprenyl-phosphate glycosyltransferase